MFFFLCALWLSLSVLILVYVGVATVSTLLEAGKLGRPLVWAQTHFRICVNDSFCAGS